jgi:hypothetical protein
VAQHGLATAQVCSRCEERRVHHLCAIAATRATGAGPGADSELCYNCYKEQNPEFPLDMTYHPYTVVFAVGKDGELTVKQAYATRGLGNCSVELCVLEQNGPQIQMQWGNRSSPVGEFEKLCLESFRGTLGEIVESLTADNLLAEFFPDSDPKARAAELARDGVWIGMPAYAAMSNRLHRRYVFFKQGTDARAPRLIRYINDSELGTEYSRTVEVLFSATGTGPPTGPMTNAHHTYLHSTTLEREMGRFPELRLGEEFAAAKLLLVRACVCVCVRVCAYLRV